MKITKKQMAENFKKNLDFFKENFPKIYEAIKNYRPTNFYFVYNGNKVDILDVKNMRPLYDFHMDEFVNFQLENFLEFSSLFMYSPSEEIYREDYQHLFHIRVIRKIIDTIKSFSSYREEGFRVPKGFTPLLVVAGMGPGLVIERLIEEFFVKKLYIYEPNLDFFYLSLFLVDWKKIYSHFDSPQDFKIQIGKPKKNAEFVIESQLRLLLERNPLVGAYILVFRHYRNEDTFKAVLKAKSAFSLSLLGWGFWEDEKEGFEHSMQNLNKESRILHLKAGYSPPKRVFIVASGPSLDQHIEFLKKHANSAIIFACGTALNPLVENGIIPDFLIELERTEHINDVLDTVDPKILKQIYLIAPDVIHPKVPPRFKETFFFIRDSGTTSHLLNPKTEVLGVFPTVANTALSLALTLKFKEIYLFGVDLGFKEEDKFHASNTVYHKEDTYFYKTDNFQKEFLVEGNFGGTVYTTSIFNWARRVMEEIIFYYSPQEVKIFNCSDGVKIAGTISLKTESLAIKPVNKKKEVEKVIKAFSNKATEALSPVPFEKLMKDISFLKKVLPMALQREVKSHEDLYYFVETIENVLKASSVATGLTTLIKGSVSHPIHTLYVHLLKLRDFSELETAFNKVKEFLPHEIEKLLSQVEELFKQYESKYRELS